MLLLLSRFTQAQVTLPAGYSFDNLNSLSNLPSGWSGNISGTLSYITGQSGTAARFDEQGEYLKFFTTAPIGTLSFYLKGWTGGGSSNWTGVYKIQESQNGINWTDLASYTALNSSVYQLYTLNPDIDSRYIRFLFSNKTIGCNVALDEVNATVAFIHWREINVLQNNHTLLSGSTSSLFATSLNSPLMLNFTIQNQSYADTLHINAINFSGTAAADYSIMSPVFPVKIAPLASQSLCLIFNPATNGTRSAALEIYCDDSDEGLYLINLYGIGGALASEPIAQADHLTFPMVKTYRIGASFTTSPDNPDGYLVLRKTSTSPITDFPTDGSIYVKGDMVGSSKVVYSGADTSFVMNNIIANTTYQLAIFTYNGNGTYTNYNTQGVLRSSITTPPSMMPVSEYNGISTTSATFPGDLGTHINPHNHIFYSHYDETMIRLFAARDTGNGQKVITCVYSGQNYVYYEPFTWGYMSREHSYCHSWMPTNPADGSGTSPNNLERPEYNDQHHLFPVNQNNVNAVRGNFPLGEVVIVQGTYLGCKYGQDASGHYVFEPRDEHKGDAARALFYMATCYNAQTNAFGVMQNWKFRNPISSVIAYGQDQDVLKKWHYQDPPDNWEIARNDFLDSLQGNRNPFIDSLDFVCHIDFSSMTKISNIDFPCGSVGSMKYTAPGIDFRIFPNPASGNFSLLMNKSSSANFTLELSATNGHIIYRQTLSGQNIYHIFNCEKLQLKPGIYFISLLYGHERLVKKLVLE